MLPYIVLGFEINRHYVITGSRDLHVLLLIVGNYKNYYVGIVSVCAMFVPSFVKVSAGSDAAWTCALHSAVIS